MMLSIVLLTLWITSGYSDSIEEDNIQIAIKNLHKDMGNFKDEILGAIRDLDYKINVIGGESELIKNTVNYMEGVLDDVNNKVSILQTDFIKPMSSIGDIAVSVDSVIDELKTLNENITSIEKNNVNRTKNYYESLNSTLNSFGTEIKSMCENEAQSIGRNISMIGTQLENRMDSIETKISVYENTCGNIFHNITDKMSSIDNEIVIQKSNSKSNEKGIKNILDGVAVIKSNMTDEFASMNSNIEENRDEVKQTKEKIDNIKDLVKVIQSNITTADSDISKALLDIKDAIQDLNSSKILTSSIGSPRNCRDLYNQGNMTPEPVQIFPYSCCPAERVYVICDQTMEFGRWTVIQRRREVVPREDFNRNWDEYAKGFGKLDGEFWIGLRLIHEMTSDSLQELYVSLEDYNGNRRWARYSSFSVGPPEDNYRLSVSGFSGNTEDGLAPHNGIDFFTNDQDNASNCAKSYGAGWWYYRCHAVLLNGRSESPEANMKWKSFHSSLGGGGYSLRSVTMMIRPKTQ